MPLWLTYSILALLITTPFYYVTRRGGGVTAQGFPRRFRLMLWMPGITALALRAINSMGFPDFGFSLDRWWILLLAVAIPFAVELILIAISLGLGRGKISEDILDRKGGKIHIGKNFGLLMKDPVQSPFMFAVNLCLSVVLGSLLLVAFTLGSEIGWRDFLQDQTVPVFGLPWGLVVVGIVWGIWLLPLVLQGYRFPKDRRLGAWLLMPLSTIAFSLIAGWLFLEAGNIWAPALFHASLIVTGDLSEVGLGEAGGMLRTRLIWIALWFLAALLIRLLLR
jgi:CAAX protease family protein